MKSVLSFILLSLFSSAYADTTSDIEKTILENLKHTQDENVTAVMGDMHTQSPAYVVTQQMLPPLFANYDLGYELLDYKFIGEDNDYAYARVKQRTVKISGPAFQNNELEMLVVFKQENGLWKLWTQANLSVLYL